MRKIRLDDLDSRMGPADVILPLTDALGATGMALNFYELDPGESFAYGFHAHERQEEVFYVQTGTVTFRTSGEPVVVEAGEVVRFGPGEYQRGVNEGDEHVVALALGAPQDAGETEILRYCETCGEETPQSLELADDKSAIVVRCLTCDGETDRYH